MTSDNIRRPVIAGFVRPRGGLETAIGHWSRLLEGLQASPQEFYAGVQAALARREIPDCRLSRVEWREGGVASARREYLRVERGDQLIDICGAPFGNGFFVSSWLCAPPPSLRTAIGLAVVSLALLGVLARSNLGALGTLLWWADGLFLLGVVGFGIVRPLVVPPRLTYYRVDTAEMFYRAVHAAVLEVIDGMSAAQGLRLLAEADRKPVLRGLSR